MKLDITNGCLKLNLNDRIKVKVTDVGKEMWGKFYLDLNLPPPSLDEKMDAQGFIEFHIWEVAKIFGPGMYNGGRCPIQTEFFLVSNA